MPTLNVQPIDFQSRLNVNVSRQPESPRRRVGLVIDQYIDEQALARLGHLIHRGLEPPQEEVSRPGDRPMVPIICKPRNALKSARNLVV